MSDWRHPFIAIWQLRGGDVVTVEPQLLDQARVCVWHAEGDMVAAYSHRLDTWGDAMAEAELIAEAGDGRWDGPARMELEVRIWIGGELAVHERLRPGPEIVLSQARHSTLIEEATTSGLSWLLEVSDPHGDVAPLRFGTDADGMVEPIDVEALGGWAAALARAAEQRERGEERMRP